MRLLGLVLISLLVSCGVPRERDANLAPSGRALAARSVDLRIVPAPVDAVFDPCRLSGGNDASFPIGWFASRPDLEESLRSDEILPDFFSRHWGVFTTVQDELSTAISSGPVLLSARVPQAFLSSPASVEAAFQPRISRFVPLLEGTSQIRIYTAAYVLDLNVSSEGSATVVTFAAFPQSGLRFRSGARESLSQAIENAFENPTEAAIASVAEIGLNLPSDIIEPGSDTVCPEPAEYEGDGPRVANSMQELGVVSDVILDVALNASVPGVLHLSHGDIAVPAGQTSLVYREGLVFDRVTAGSLRELPVRFTAPGHFEYVGKVVARVRAVPNMPTTNAPVNTITLHSLEPS